MTLHEYLLGLRQDVPPWLEKFGPGSTFSAQEFFGSRVVYYPGSGFDGHPVKVFASAHSAHSFVYVDDHVTPEQLEAELDDARKGFRGYRSVARIRIQEGDLVPGGWTPHVDREAAFGDSYRRGITKTALFGFLEVMERKAEYNDSHGAQRIAILFLKADGKGAFDALFCQGSGAVPFAVVIQDHGFGGGNCDHWGQGGRLERIAVEGDVRPEWLLVADNTRVWLGFRRISNVDGDGGGMHGHRRSLYARTSH